jgi:DNA polymerase III delta subunit
MQAKLLDQKYKPHNKINNILLICQTKKGINIKTVIKKAKKINKQTVHFAYNSIFNEKLTKWVLTNFS